MEMSRFVLEIRDNNRNEERGKQRLEFLAEQFLRITGQSRESSSIALIQNANRTPDRVTLTM
jgi:hypothetical protein